LPAIQNKLIPKRGYFATED